MIHSNFSGLWHADLGRSRIAGPVPSKMRVKIAHADVVLTQEVMIAYPNGRAEGVWENLNGPECRIKVRRSIML